MILTRTNLDFWKALMDTTAKNKHAINHFSLLLKDDEWLYYYGGETVEFAITKELAKLYDGDNDDYWGN